MDIMQGCPFFVSQGFVVKERTIRSFVLALCPNMLYYESGVKIWRGK